MKFSETRAAIRDLKKLCQQDDMYGTQLEQLTDFQNVLTSHRKNPIPHTKSSKMIQFQNLRMKKGEINTFNV